MLLDLPIPELFKWQGINPRPQDHDAYWERALAEMNSLDAQAEFIPASFKTDYAECYDLYFTGVRNARIHAKFAKPKKVSGRCPAVFMFHGYTGNSGNWINLLPYVAAGFAVAFLDCRGQGGFSEDSGGVKWNTMHGQIIRGLDEETPDNLLFRHIFLDTAQLVQIVSALPEVDEGRLGCFGGSQGGALTLACAALCPQIKKAAPQYPFLCDYKRVWELDLAKNAYQELKDYFRMFDPRHEREEAIWTRLGYIDNQFLAPRIKADVLLFTGIMDDICPPSSQFAAYNKIESKKEVKFYPDFGHEWLPDADDMTFQLMSELR
ncbi:MAG: acetylxylan esterase [Spirochaetaceae bacterium]|jgi:cephalosporin-C deacetylase|nr:acetylxylan esterase [Spirochaetaceae bacterium]